MKTRFIRLFKLATILILFVGMSACDDPQVYGSIGISSYGGGGYHGGGRGYGSVSIGGRIY